MQDKQLLRYSRQLMLPQIEIDGQEKLVNASVLILGLGGLGSPVSMYLAAAGIGTLWLCDDDKVEISNLQRQIVHHTHNIEKEKVISAQEQLIKINPEVDIKTIPYRLEGDELLAKVKQVDVVVDATDNLESRFAINRACVKAKKPLVSGAAVRWEGQVSVYQPYLDNMPCYHCFYGNVGAVDMSCSTNGVVGSLLGVIGSLQATEVIKLITGAGETLTGRVQLFDALSMEWTQIKLPKHPNCSVCGEEAV